MEEIGLLLRGRADNADGDGRFGRLTAVVREAAGLEVASVELDGLARAPGRKEVRKGIGQAFRGGGHRRPHAGAEQPDIGRTRGRRRDRDVAKGVVRVLGRKAHRVEVGLKLGELLRKVVGLRTPARAAQGKGLQLTAAGRAPDTEIDAVGEHGMQRTEDLGDLERGVVWQHHAAGADANVRGHGSGTGDQDLRGRAGQHIHCVVLGVPEPCVAEAVDVPGQIQ